MNNYVKLTNVDESADRNIRKFLPVKILNKNIKLQLDSGSDLNNNKCIYMEKIGKLTLIVTKKIRRGIHNKSDVERANVEIKIVLKNINNLF